MKYRLTFLYCPLFILYLSFNACKKEESLNFHGSILVCGDSKVLIVKNTGSYDSIPKILWSWDAHLSNDLPFEFRTQKFNSIDDCKSVNKGKQILISSSSGAIALVNIIDKKVIFYASVPNAHSIEMLPDNKIVAAASTHINGNKLMLFDINTSEKVIFSDSLYSAHGVVWDSNRNSLFALGYDVLREYKIENKIKLYLVEEWRIPGISGHDLQMASSEDKLYITERTGTWSFDIQKKQFGKIEQFPDTTDIKSLCENRMGQFVYTVPEQNWWTFHIRLHNPTGRIHFPNLHVYKARWFE